MESMRSRKKRAYILFVLVMSIFTVLFFVAFSRNPLGLQMNVFFGGTRDLFADIFNVGRYAAQPNPYIGENRVDLVYLPFSYMIMLFFARVGGFVVQDTPYTLHFLVASLFVSFSTMIFFLQLFHMTEGRTVKKLLLAFILINSSIYLFSFERGNNILLSAICLLFFIINYNHENKYIREVALVLLAFSVGLKVYPGVFALLLLYERRYKEIVRFSIYTFVVVFAPFFAFEGGLSNVRELISNLGESTNSYRLGSFKRFGIGYAIRDGLLSGNSERINVDKLILFERVTMVLSALSICVSFFIKTRWKLIAILTCVLIMLPVNSAFYCGLYFLPVVIMFLDQAADSDSRSPIFWIYLILFIAILIPFQFGSISHQLPNICMIIVWFMLIADGVRSVISWIIKRVSIGKECTQ